MFDLRYPLSKNSRYQRQRATRGAGPRALWRNTTSVKRGASTPVGYCKSSNLSGMAALKLAKTACSKANL